MSAGKSVPSRWHYFRGCVVLVMGLIVFAAVLGWGLSGMTEGFQRMIVPGEHELQLAEKGTYTVFHEYRSVSEETAYSVPRGDLSGLECRLISKATGERIALSPCNASVEYSMGGRSGVGIWQFTVDSPGTYVFSAEYPSGEEGADTVLAVGRGFVGRLVATILGSLVAMLLGVGGAIAIIVVTFVRRQKADKEISAENETN